MGRALRPAKVQHDGWHIVQTPDTQARIARIVTFTYIYLFQIKFIICQSMFRTIFDSNPIVQSKFII